MGAMFAGSECVVEKIRAKHDIYNAGERRCAQCAASPSPPPLHAAFRQGSEGLDRGALGGAELRWPLHHRKWHSYKRWIRSFHSLWACSRNARNVSCSAPACRSAILGSTPFIKRCQSCMLVCNAFHSGWTDMRILRAGDWWCVVRSICGVLHGRCAGGAGGPTGGMRRLRHLCCLLHRH